MKYLFASLLLLLSNFSFACWKMQAQITVNEKIINVDQKVKHDETYSYQSGPYLINIKSSPSGKSHLIRTEVLKKEKTSLTKISNDQILINEGQKATMTKEDKDTNLFFQIEIKLTKI